jgi:hypothetical protein
VHRATHRSFWNTLPTPRHFLYFYQCRVTVCWSWRHHCAKSNQLLLTARFSLFQCMLAFLCHMEIKVAVFMCGRIRSLQPSVESQNGAHFFCRTVTLCSSWLDMRSQKGFSLRFQTVLIVWGLLIWTTVAIHQANVDISWCSCCCVHDSLAANH